MSKQAGREAKLYYCATPLADVLDATITGATWVEVTSVQDVKLSNGTKEGNITTRKGKRATTKVVLLDESMDLEFPEDTADAALGALRTAYYGPSLIALAFMNGPIETTGSKGVVGNFSVTKFDVDEPHDNIRMRSVTVKPGDDNVTEFTVPSGS